MKVSFNLLPWREELQREAKQDYIRQSVLAVILGSVLVGAGYFGMTLRVSAQEAKNERVVRANAQADEKIKEIKDLQSQLKVLNERKKVVESLQNSRNQATRIMEQMGVKLPEGVFLLNLKQTGPKLRLTGIALNQSLVALTMTSLDNSEWFAEPTLIEIKAVDAKSDSGATVKANNFIVDVRYTNPDDVVLPGLVLSPAAQISQKLRDNSAPLLPPPPPSRGLVADPVPPSANSAAAAPTAASGLPPPPAAVAPRAPVAPAAAAPTPAASAAAKK